MPIFHACAQGSEKWLRLRMGMPTASCFDRIVTPSGRISSQADAYQNEILAELILGRVLQGPNLAIMQRGHDLESHAVEYYEFQKDISTEPIGFVTTDDLRYGASPDRTVGEEGILEVKCPAAGTHVGYMLAGSAEHVYYPQIQGQLLVTGRQWVDIISYYPEMPMVLSRVERDEKFIALLSEQLDRFCTDLEAKTQILIDRGYYTPAQPAIRDPMEISEEDHLWGAK